MGCPRCGHELPTGATGCGRCGAYHPSAPWAPAWESPTSSPPSAGRTGWLVASVLTVLLVTVSATAGVLLTREPTSVTQSRSPASEVVATEERVGAAALPASPAGDFSQVYADVQDGIGRVSVVSCDGESFTGSAFLVDEDTMLTAGHVVADTTDVSVDLDGKAVDVTVETIELNHDLALLRLDAPVPGHVFRFSAADLRTGMPVAAIGFPMGEAKTLTVGAISGLDRDISTETGDYEGMVQTDTAINPGSSGGPLLDASGEVVAVADAMRTDAHGIGFGIPAATAAGVADGVTPGTPPEPCR